MTQHLAPLASMSRESPHCRLTWVLCCFTLSCAGEVLFEEVRFRFWGIFFFFERNMIAGKFWGCSGFDSENLYATHPTLVIDVTTGKGNYYLAKDDNALFFVYYLIFHADK